MATPADIAAARARGYKGDFGSGGYNAFTSGAADAYGRPVQAAPTPPSGSGAGVVPATAVPLHAAEVAGARTLAEPSYLGGGLMGNAVGMLQQMQSNPQAYAQQYTNPMATDYMGRAGEATAAGSRPLTAEEITSMSNPFAGALKNRLNEQADIQRAGINAGQGMRGARSFGDTSQGVRMGMLDKEVLSKSGDIDYQMFNDAAGLLERGRDRSLNAGGQYGNLATGAQGITNNAMGQGLQGINALFSAGQTARKNTIENASNQMGAGKYIRDYNQGVSDMIGNDILAGQQYPEQNIQRIMNMLSGFGSNNSGSTPGANSMERAGGLTDIASAFLSPGGGPLNPSALMSGLPWSDRRLKERIVSLGRKEGIPLYEFSYIGKDGRYRGVMADEVAHIPGAVHTVDGYMAVDYSKLPVEFERVA